MKRQIQLTDDAAAIAKITTHCGGDGPREVLHYLYLADRVAADSIASELRVRGFGAEVLKSASDEKWVILARHRIVLTESQIAAVRESMEVLAETAGGEYDGWEVAER